MIKRVKMFFPALVFWLVFLIGCSGGTGPGAGILPDGQGGTFRMSVAWPDKSGGTDGKYIPADTDLIRVSIEGTGLDTPATDDISYPQSVLTVDNLPAGQKVATIEAVDDGNATVRRKESFIIMNGRTTDTGNLPLGVAITGSSASPAFEPTAINAPFGFDLYFQNWTDGDFTCRVLINNSIQTDLSLQGKRQDAQGEWVFSQGSVRPVETTACQLAEAPSVTCNVSAPVTNYEFEAKLGSAGSGNEQFNGPFGIARDLSGNIYVSDYNNKRIMKFNSSLDYVTRW